MSSPHNTASFCSCHCLLIIYFIVLIYRFAHRLDFATSGLLCIGLTKKSTRWAANAFRKRKVMKHYLALVRHQQNNYHFN